MGSQTFIAMDNGAGDVYTKVTVERVTEHVPMPVIVNSISSNGTGPWKIESAKIGNGGSCSIIDQTGSWVASISHPSTGRCEMTFAAGAFSSSPTCICTVLDTNQDRGCHIRQATWNNTSLVVEVTNLAGSLVDNHFNVMCMGPR
jgi:hypothetical protein